MAARDAQFYNYLKEALKNKLRYPEATSFRFGEYFLDYDFIFQEARRVLPQKYSIGHSYWEHDNQRIPISYLNKQQLNELNLEFAREVVASWGGFEEAPTDQRYLDPVLVEYENELTAPEEPDSFHEEIGQHQLPQDQEEEQAQEQQEEQGQPSSGGQRQQPPPRYVFQRPGLTREQQAKLDRANESMQQTKKKLAGPEEDKPQLSDRMSQRLNAANRAMRRTAPSQSALEDRRKKAASLLRKPTTTSGWNPLGDWAAKKIGEKIAQSKLGQAVARNFIDPLKQAITNSRAWQAIAPRIQPLINAYNTVAAPFRAVGNWLGGPERFLNARAADLANWAGRGLQNGIAQAARGAGNQIGNVVNWARNNPIPTLGVPGGVAAGWGYITAAVAGISLAAWIVIIALIASFVFYIFAAFDLNSECGKPGTPSILKSVINGKDDQQGNKVFQQGEQINYQIQVLYQLKCGGYVDVDLKDPIPAGTTYVEGSIKADTQVDWQGLSGTTSTQGRDGNILFWNIKSLPNRYPITLNFSVTADQPDAWIANQAQATFKAYGRFGQPLSGSKIIDSQSASFQEVVNRAAERNGMPPALMKAVLAVEAPGVLTYSEEEFLKFSQPGWWEGLDESHPDIERGYAYNSCPRNGCAPLDVRGVAQFLSTTWESIALQLNFLDKHTPDRRNATDSIYGSALYNRQNAEKYIVGSSNVAWTEDVVKAMGRVYCAGAGAATDPSKINNAQCRNYDNLLWDYYQQFLAQP